MYYTRTKNQEEIVAKANRHGFTACSSIYDYAYIGFTLFGLVLHTNNPKDFGDRAAEVDYNTFMGLLETFIPAGTIKPVEVTCNQTTS